MLQLIKLLTAKRNQLLAPFQQYVYKITDNGIQLETEKVKTLTIPIIGPSIDIPQPGIDIRLEPSYVSYIVNETVIISEDVYKRRITELENTVQELMDQIEMLTRNGNTHET